MRTERKRLLVGSVYSPRFAVGWIFPTSEFVMAPRAYWKSYLKLFLVSCPIANAPSDPSRRTWSISWTPLGAASRRAVRLHQTRRKSGRQLLGVHLKNPNTQSGKGRAVPAELSSRKTAFNHPQDRPGVCPSWCAPLTEHRARADTCICGVAALGGRSHHRPAFGRTQLGCA